MKRYIPGLHSQQEDHKSHLEGLFLVRVDSCSYRWDREKPFLWIRFIVIEPFSGRSLSARLYCTERALWKLNWFLRDFGYDTDLLGRDEVDEKALIGLAGIVRTSRRVMGSRVFLNLEGFGPSSEWEYPLTGDKQTRSEVSK